MISAIKTTCIVMGTIFFLSITINNKTIFGHIYGVISPLTKGTQKLAQGVFDSSLEATQDYSKKLFNNSVPKFKDSVKSKSSGLSRSISQEPADNVTPEEKAQLDDLIKSHH